MPRRLLFSLVAALCPPLSSAADPPAKPEGDVSTLVGEWRYRSMTVDGKAADEKAVANCRLVVGKDGSVSVYDGTNRVVAGRITRVSADRTPGEIDLVLAGRSEFSGRFEPESAELGIFEAGKDALRVCRTRGRDKEKRPTEFAAPEGKNLVLEEFERIR